MVAGGAAAPVVEMLDTRERLPWAGHTARHALGEMYDLIKRNKTTLVFVNTRSQAEMIFNALWTINEDSLAIALHHESARVLHSTHSVHNTSPGHGNDVTTKKGHVVFRIAAVEQLIEVNNGRVFGAWGDIRGLRLRHSC